MQELKPGDTKEFKVGDKTLVVEAIPFGKLKKVIRLIAEVSKQFDSKELQEDILNIVPTIVERYVEEFIPLLFSAEKHPFLTKEWVDDNLTIPVVKDVLISAITINGLGDFFAKTVKAPAPKTVQPQSSGTSSIPSESIGSTTPSDSPTDGDLVRSTH